MWPDSPTKLFIQQNFFTKELVHGASSIRLTTVEEYQHQPKQARSRLPHKANNQYAGGILERRCGVRGSMCIKTHGIAMHVVGEVLIYERELTTI